MVENEYGRPAAGAPRLSGPRPSYPGELERNCAAFSGKGGSVLATPNPVLRLHELSSADPHRIRVLGHCLHRRHITAARIKVGQYLIRAHGGNMWTPLIPDEVGAILNVAALERRPPLPVS